MKLLISIADFPDFTPFSKNISAHLVTPHIRDAQTFDVKLGAALYEQLELALSAVQPEFIPTEFDTAEFFTSATNAGWPDPKLATLWYSVVRPLLVSHAARRMMLWHGLHITPDGAESTAERPISPQERAALRADLQAKCSHYESLLTAALRTYLPTTSPATCTTTRRRPTHGGLRTFTA